MCRDIAKYYNHMLNFQEWNVVDNVPVHKYELKIIERILLELYCQNVYDNRIRTCLNKGIVRRALQFIHKNYVSNDIFL